RYGKAIEPLLCLSIDFYVRLFVRLKNSPASVKMLPSTSMITYLCSGCGSWVNQPMGRVTNTEKVKTKFSNAPGPTASSNCQHCGFKSHIAGPMWAGALHDKEFVSKMLETAKTLDPNVYPTRPRIEGMLTLALEELPGPFFFTPSRLASKLHSSTPPHSELLSALLNAGFKVSASHCIPGSIKTDASNEDIWDIMRQWIKENPIKEENVKDGTVAKTILEKRDPSFQVSFEEHVGIAALGRRPKLVRYQRNPTKNWGPGTKSKRKTLPVLEAVGEAETRKR
ncbi:tRNA (guanine(26)-N(2))-dimethyltransferase, partial [Neolecta irregularis DAH-3]